jgi:signal transduction histidine kinase
MRRGTGWSGERPPWWPENAAWPPRRGHGMPRVFRRMFFGFLFFLLLLNASMAVIGLQIAHLFGVVDVPPNAVVFSLATAFLLLLLLFVTMAIAFATFSRTAGRLKSALEAVDKVAEGDYTARVPERGPRDLRRLATSFNTMVERLGAAEAQRRRLLADVTHELRTPLSVIQGRLEGVLDGVYPRDEATLGAILDETRHMSRIIEDLRVLSLAESGGLRLVRTPVDVGEVADDAIDAYRGAAESAGVALASEIPADLPAADADATRVREVVENLLSNAIRYTPSGGSVMVAARRDGDAAIAVTVADTGRGVPADELPRLFERFHRSPDSPGTGLGLAIARDLVRAHGGDLTAASDGEGKGTTMRFTLPAAG